VARNAAQMDAERLPGSSGCSRRWRSSGTTRRASCRRAEADAGRGRAIVEPRELLIVDEPSKGLAPSIINNMIDAFAQLKASGVSILLVEQNIQLRASAWATPWR
jgi:branched-chain amino acid transport system ATP-binding protein